MKNNIKFIIKFLIVGILALFILTVASAVYKNGETYEGTYSGIEKYKSVPDAIDYANFGPSYGMNCFNYETIEKKGKTGFNFALTMQDLYHDYAIYKTYENNFSDGAVVAIPLSYFSFCTDTEAPTGTRYYKILPREYIKDYTLEKYVSARFIPIYGKGNALIRDLSNDMINSIMSKTVDSNTDDNTGTKQDKKSKQLSKDSETRVFTIENGNLKIYGKYIETNEEMLVNWIEKMQKKGLKPVLLLTPYWYEYANGFDEELLKVSYIEPVLRIVEKTGVDYINFCDKEYDEFIHTPEYFSNCDHISQKGSEAFMELFLSYLEDNGLI